MKQNNFMALGILTAMGFLSFLIPFPTLENHEPSFGTGIVWVNSCDSVKITHFDGRVRVTEGNKSFLVPREPTKKFLIREILGRNCQEIEQ